ncbi:MAG: hypothetical protein EBS53_17935 [Bacteroidetes bacterium]|nr:hypothetical protein [Bacteroidota bacterium]
MNPKIRSYLGEKYGFSEDNSDEALRNAIEQANNVVEKEHPDLIGCLGDYFLDKNDYFTKHMIHFDTHGIDCRYTQ